MANEPEVTSDAQDSMKSRVRQWLEKTGFGLELEVAAAFRAEGFDVRQASHFIDRDSGKSREIDVVACDPNDMGIVEIGFIVECKRSTKPWVLLSSSETLDGYNRVMAVGLLSDRARDAMIQRLGREEAIEMILPWFKKDSRVAYSLRQAFAERDLGYATTVAIAKATDAWVNTGKSIDHNQLKFGFPLIVTDAPILECFLDASGTVELREIDQGEVLFSGRAPVGFGACIRIISARSISAFAKEAYRVATLLRANLKEEEERMMLSWRQSHGDPTAFRPRNMGA